MLVYTSVELNPYICKTPPFLPPSLKGKGKSTLAYEAHIYYLKVALWYESLQTIKIKLTLLSKENVICILVYVIHIMHIKNITNIIKT